MPALVLDEDAIAAVELRDQRLAHADLGRSIRQTIAAMGPDGTPPNSPLARGIEQVRQLYLDWGASEAGGGGSHSVPRRDAIRAAVASVLAHDGADAIRSLRASLLLELPAALAGRDDEVQDAAMLGAFPRMLTRYGLTRDGAVVGPAFVVRVLYAARFNSILGLPPTSDFAPVEARAYWGWLALGAQEVSPERRMDAVDQYELAGGDHVLEARAYLLFALGRGTHASGLYEEAYRRSGNMRLRNHAMAAASLEP